MIKAYFRDCPNTKNNPKCKKTIGYNTDKNCKNAENNKTECCSCKNFGSERNEESKLKISKSLEGKKKSLEHNKHNSESHKGQIAWNKNKTNIEIFGK